MNKVFYLNTECANLTRNVERSRNFSRGLKFSRVADIDEDEGGLGESGHDSLEVHDTFCKRMERVKDVKLLWRVRAILNEKKIQNKYFKLVVEMGSCVSYYSKSKV
jgi:hypothetical protein